MKVYELILANCDKKLKITIADNESNEEITCFDKSKYISTIDGYLHLYDDRDVYWWLIKQERLWIYIE